jgi:hypothetical protein
MYQTLQTRLGRRARVRRLERGGCGARRSHSTIGKVTVSREHVVHILRRAGLREVADEAEKELPVSLDLEEAMNWCLQHGVTHDEVISQLGGSP